MKKSAKKTAVKRTTAKRKANRVANAPSAKSRPKTKPANTARKASSTAKASAARETSPAKKTIATPPEPDGRLTFNHAMIYVKDVARALEFYRELMGFKLIEDFRYEGKSVYARLRAPGGDGTIALHLAGPGVSLASEGVRLYFEVGDLDGFCRKLQQKGFYITQLPRMMPWGWRHAYLNDPDGHEISLYWAGEKRMQKTVMQAAKDAART